MTYYKSGTYNEKTGKGVYGNIEDVNGFFGDVDVPTKGNYPNSLFQGNEGVRPNSGSSIIYYNKNQKQPSSGNPISSLQEIDNGIAIKSHIYNSDPLAACMENNPGKSTFSIDELNQYMNLGYIDKYSKDSTVTSFDKRILGDATGEMGPFYQYYTGDKNGEYSDIGSLHLFSSWSYLSHFIQNSYYWFSRGGSSNDGDVGGQFYFTRDTGDVISSTHGFRVVFGIK